MDIVDDLRKDSRDEKEQYKREARTVMRRLLKEAADEIVKLRKALRLAGDREPLASFQQKDIGSSTIRVGEETKLSRDARNFNGGK